ncbi:MAG: bifunctional isocitrate dehydrogenase kinase/phosphatase [Chromatiales bacterium]|nr:bifunctional isocitrate dehydrogenase kinase/phosphatase [Chromatiales bacterium]
MDGSNHDAAVQALAGRSAAAICTAFEDYNDSFRSITQRAQRRFEMREWQLGQRDAVERIELYDHRVERCLAGLVGMLGRHIAEEATWNAARTEFSRLTADRPDRQFYATFFNSLTRKVFATIGVNPAVEFVTEADEPPQGAAPVREIGLQQGLVRGLESLLAGLPWAAQLHDAPRSARFIDGEIRGVLAVRGLSSGLARLEVLEPVFYRATRAYVVGRVSGEGWTFPLVIAFAHPESGIVADTVMISDYELRPLFGFSRSYFHVDLAVVEAVVRYLCSIMPGKPVDELYAVLGRAKQGKTERYRRLFRHLAASTDLFVHAEGVRGMVMVVFTLNSSDLVFKVIRDRFDWPKTTSRAEVMEKYRFVFRHDRVGRLVDAQEFRRLRFPRARFAPELLDELMNSAADTCRLDGDDLIIDLCYVERRLKPLDVYLREAEPAAARRAIRDYGQAIRDLALSNVFPGDLLLKNFGVSRHGRVIFYDYDELCLVTECRFRDLPAARDNDEEMRAEPWFYVGPDDVFPEQFIEFLGLRGELRDEFLKYHAALLDADYWRQIRSAHAAEAHLEVVPYQRRQISHILATP